MSEEKTSRLWREAGESPAIAAYVEANFSGSSVQSLERQLLEQVDASDFSLREWLDGLVLLTQWLEARGLELGVADQIGYVNCAAEAAGAGSGLSRLPSLVEEMLDDFGCERAAPKEG